MLGLLEKLADREFEEIITPQGHRIAINPLFHSNLAADGNLGDYEPEIRTAVVKFAKPGMAAYDIGANVGIFSFLFASIVGREGMVYAFEPERNNFTCFERSLSLNDAAPIHLDKRAVSNSKGKQQFDRRGGAFSGRLIGQGHSYDPTDNVDLVEAITIDGLIEEEGFRVPDILKIDVEGNEGMVLEGMRHTLEKYQPIIICELHTHLGESSDDVIDMLTSCGYSISDVASAVAEEWNPAASDDVSGLKHIVAMRRETTSSQ